MTTAIKNYCSDPTKMVQGFYCSDPNKMVAPIQASSDEQSVPAAIENLAAQIDTIAGAAADSSVLDAALADVTDAAAKTVLTIISDVLKEAKLLT